MIREINELILLLDKNETGFTLYRVFGKSGTVDIADRKKDHTNKDIENEDLYIKRECDKINKIAPYCFSEKLHLPEKLQNEYDEIDIDKTIYHEFAGEFANSIKLPDGVMQIGNNAFYNCKKLESITIGKNIKEVGSDVFMNCRSLNKIYLRSDISDITGLKQVLSRISSEIEVIYIKEEKVIAKVLYPEYSEVYDEIAPAHIFGRNIEGEGFRARQCFDGGKADMNQYDTIFPKASAEESVKVAGKIALYRLIYPYMLGSSSEVLYMDYLKNNKNEIIGSCIYDKNIDEIKFMLEKFSGDRSMIERAIVVANETGFGEAAALLYTTGSGTDLRWNNWNLTSPTCPLNIFRPAETLSLQIWGLQINGQDPNLANLSAAILMILVLLFSIGANALSRHINKKNSGN